MELLKALLLLVLSVIFIQDIKSRMVYWVLFPLLAILLITIRLTGRQSEMWKPAMFNYCFLVIQFLLVSMYFSLKNGHWVNLTEELFGWGDILLLLCLACYLSVLNFLIFYLSSLIVIVLYGAALKLIVNLVNQKQQLSVKTNNLKIPFAGLQSLLLGLFLSADWWSLHFNAISDDWLLNFIGK